MRPSKARRGISVLAVASAAVAMVSVSPAAHAASSIGGQITAAEMMTRAQYWVDNHVPYTESGATYQDPEGTGYREDCSGFVSMAWHLGTSLIVTDPAPADFTNVDGTPNTAYDHGIGAFSNLQQGDAMAYPHEHIFLFDEWTNKSTGDFTYYAESNPSDPTHGPTAANINNANLEGWPASGYVGLRYNNVASAIPTGFNVALDANGSAAAGQTLSGNVNLTAMASAQGYINTLTYSITGPGGYSTTVNGGSGSSNYAQTWNTTGLANGTYSISATANEIDGQNHAYGPVSVTVNNGLSSSGGLAATANGGFNIAWQGRDSNNSLWVTSGSGTTLNPAAAPYSLGVADGTTPSMATLSDGTWVAAWQGRDTGHTLWLATGSGTTMTWHGNPWALGVAPGTSPAVIALPNGGYELAWQGMDANNSLWVTSGNGANVAQPNDPYALGVAPNTSPALAALSGGNFEVAWQGRDSNNSLWVTSGNGTTLNAAADPYALGVAPNTSPALAPLTGGNFEVAWQGRDANNSLWVTSGSGSTLNAAADPYALGVAPNTSPALAPLSGGNFEVAWQGRDSNNSLWVTSGHGSTLNAAADPYAYGVAAGRSPSLVTYPNGSFEVAWKGRDANGSLWITTGSGSTLNPAADPYALGVA